MQRSVSSKNWCMFGCSLESDGIPVFKVKFNFFSNQSWLKPSFFLNSRNHELKIQKQLRPFTFFQKAIKISKGTRPCDGDHKSRVLRSSYFSGFEAKLIAQSPRANSFPLLRLATEFLSPHAALRRCTGTREKYSAKGGLAKVSISNRTTFV